VTSRAIADFEWRGGQLVRLSAKERAAALAALFASLENGLDVTDAAETGESEAAIASETWLALRELARAYGLFASGLRIAADGARTPIDGMTASRLNELNLAIAAAEARVMGALATERSRWLSEFLSQP